MPKHSSQFGFSLLEAIVALVILSGGLMAAYSWFDRGLDALIRMDKLALEESVVQEAIERLHLHDFSSKRTGEFEWQDYTIEWSAELYQPTTKGISNVGSISYFDFSLYRVNLLISYKSRAIARHSLYMQDDSLKRPPPS